MNIGMGQEHGGWWREAYSEYYPADLSYEHCECQEHGGWWGEVFSEYYCPFNEGHLN